MAYTFLSGVNVGTAGLTLTASVVDSTGSALGVQPAYTIVELGNGWYGYYTAAMADGTVGWVKILNASVVEGVIPIAPFEAEGKLSATQAGVTIPTVTTVGAVTTVNGLAADVITAASIATDAIGSSELAQTAADEIAARTWAALYTGAQLADSFGELISTILDVTISSRLAPSGTVAQVGNAALVSIGTAIYDLANGIETGLTFRQSQRLLRAVMFGVSNATDNEAGTVVFYRKDGTTPAGTAVYNAEGDRTSTTEGSL